MIHVEAADGTDVLSFLPTKQFQFLVFSSAELDVGVGYLVYVGGSSTGGSADGLYTGGAYTPGTEAGSFTLDS